ncbi:MAG: tetratricopeptide repeat protein [Thermodesulfobacteriota bacterium]|nr:tetratricopeptide repeat protein [Thermodesulfobacteriota bacterium]
MDLFLSIVLIAGPLLLGTYLSTRDIPRRIKRMTWIICLIICILGAMKLIRDMQEKRENSKIKQHSMHLLERQELRSQDYPERYINGLGENPLLKHHFFEGQRYEKESKFREAIEEFKKCLFHPMATEENKVAAHILIGICYYNLPKLKEAEKYYKEALSISKRVKDKSHKLEGKSVALGNIGLIYRDKGELDNALKYHKDALEIAKEIGYRQGQANQLGNIGLIYRDKGELDNALKYHKDALEDP